HPANRAILEGQETKFRLELPLDFTEPKVQRGLPSDTYATSTNIPGLDAWRRNVDLLPASLSPPMYYTRSPAYEPKVTRGSAEDKKPVELPRLTIKTRFGLAGRLGVFSQTPDPLAADLFIDKDVLKILNLLLYGQEQRPEKEQRSLLKAVGKSAVRVLAETLILPGEPGSEGAPPTAATARPASAASPPPPEAIVQAPPADEDAAPPPPQLPRDPDELREILARHLEVIDLLVLDPSDVDQLRRSSETAAVVRRFVDNGGALFAFVSENGDYGEVVGAPLVVAAAGKPTDRFSLVPGEVGSLLPRFDKKKMKVKSRRALPELSSTASWRVIAFTQGRKEPRILERGKREDGGYVALWLDDPESFRGRLGGTVPQVEETRAKLEEHVLDWARYLMYRRYDKGGDQRRHAEQALVR